MYIIYYYLIAVTTQCESQLMHGSVSVVLSCAGFESTCATAGHSEARARVDAQPGVRVKPRHGLPLAARCVVASSSGGLSLLVDRRPLLLSSSSPSSSSSSPGLRESSPYTPTSAFLRGHTQTEMLKPRTQLRAQRHSSLPLALVALLLCALAACLSLPARALSATGQRVLVVLPGGSSAESQQYSQFLGDLTERGFQLSYRSTEESGPKLVEWEELNFEHLVFLADEIRGECEGGDMLFSGESNTLMFLSLELCFLWTPASPTARPKPASTGSVHKGRR